MASKNWQSLLGINENKVELFEYLASKICKIDIQSKKNYTTLGEDVACVPQTLDKEDLEPCTQQKADGRIILHVAKQGYHNTRGHHSISRGGGGGGLEYF